MPFIAPVLVAVGVEAATAASIAATAASVASVAAVAGTVVSAVGAIQQGEQAKKTAEYNAAVENQRAQIAKDQSGAQAAIDAANSRRKLGEAATAYGAAGVDMTGTPLAVMSDLATQGELTRHLTLYKGDLSATADQQQGALDQASGKAQQTASYFQAGSTLLTGLGKAGASFYPGSSAPSGSPLTLPASQNPAGSQFT